MKIKLDKYDLKLVNDAAKMESRPILNNICLRKGEFSSADGFMLITRDADIVEGEVNNDVMIPAEIIKEIKINPDKQAELEIEGDILSVSYKNKYNCEKQFSPTLVFKPFTDGVFPNYSALFPEDTEKKAVIALSVDLLKKALDTMPNDGILRIGIPKHNDTDLSGPVEFECSNMDRPIRGMLMPMYVEWKSFKWHRKIEEVKVDVTDDQKPIKES